MSVESQTLNLASFYIKYKTPDFYLLSSVQYTIPHKNTIDAYKAILNENGVDLLDHVLEKVKNEEYTDELTQNTKYNIIIWGYTDSGSWFPIKKHPFKINNGINGILCSKDNWYVMAFSNKKQSNIKTSIIRFIDPNKKWVYTVSGSLYKISDN